MVADHLSPMLETPDRLGYNRGLDRQDSKLTEALDRLEQYNTSEAVRADPLTGSK